MSIQTGESLALAALKALRIDSRMVLDVSLSMKANEIASVTVVRAIDSDDQERLTSVLERYALTKMDEAKPSWPVREFHSTGEPTPFTHVGDFLKPLVRDTIESTRDHVAVIERLQQINALLSQRVAAGAELAAPSAPSGLTRSSMDGERNGRLGWTPGA